MTFHYINTRWSNTSKGATSVFFSKSQDADHLTKDSDILKEIARSKIAFSTTKFGLLILFQIPRRMGHEKGLEFRPR